MNEDDWVDRAAIDKDGVHKGAADLGTPGKLTDAESTKDALHAFLSFCPIEEWYKQDLLSSMDAKLKVILGQTYWFTYGKLGFLGLNIICIGYFSTKTCL